MENNKNKEEAKKLIDSKKLVIIDFFASWCGPCQMFIPVFEEFAKNNKDIEMFKVDIDNDADFAGESNVQGVPTIIAYKDGKELSRFSGFKSAEELKEFVDSVK